MFRFAILLSALLSVVPSQGFAQGMFESFAFPKTVITTGHTEVLGPVHLALVQGSIVADTLVIDVSPLRVTNRSAADIQVTTSGNISAETVVLEPEERRVRVPVNTGGNNGFLRVDGIRVSLAGSNSTSVSARLSWAGRQNILSQRDSVVVVNQVRSGLVVDRMSDLFAVVNNVVVDNTGTIVLHEGYDSAFVNGSDFGENTDTYSNPSHGFSCRSSYDVSGHCDGERNGCHADDSRRHSS
jgi:hypothetical protein